MMMYVLMGDSAETKCMLKNMMPMSIPGGGTPVGSMRMYTPTPEDQKMRDNLSFF
jgi:hypothetical protein